MKGEVKRPNSEKIETGIFTLCEALNEIDGVSTFWSCEGHPDRSAPPFVMSFCSHYTVTHLDLAHMADVIL